MRFPRSLLVEYARRAAEEGLLVGPEGNLSLKVKDRVYLTPSGVFKKDLRPEDVTVVEPSGKVLEGRRPSSELLMHLKIYEARPDISAVIHAHPPYTLALSLAGEDFSKAYLAETVIYLKEVGLVPYFKPGSEELAQAVAEETRAKNVLVLERHGAVALGKDLAEALNLLLILEKGARVTWLAKALTPELKPLSPEEVKALWP